MRSRNLDLHILITIFFFFWVPSVFLGLFSSLLEQYLLPSAPGSILSNVGTTLVARYFWAFNYIDYFMFYPFYCA